MNQGKNMFNVVVNEQDFKLTLPISSITSDQYTVSVEYDTVESLVKAMQNVMKNNAALQAALTANKATMSMTYVYKDRVDVSFINCYLDISGGDSIDIARLLGAEINTAALQRRGIRWFPKVELQNVTSLASMPRNLMVYLPDLIQNSLVGGQNTSLVRCVQMTGSIGSVQTFQPSHILYYDVAPTGYRMDRVRVQVRNSFGELVKFQWGSLVAILEFRPILPFAPY
jgi:hypothetical protein